MKKQKHDFHFFRSVYNRTIVRFGFCDIQNIQGLCKGYQPQPSASADNLYPNLYYSGYHSNLVQKLFIIFGRGYCDIQNNEGWGKGYQPKPNAEADNPYLDLDYSGYHKNLIQ